MRSLIGLAALSAVLILGGCMTHGKGRVAAQMGIPTGFLNKTMTVDGKERSYVLYVPREFDPATPWPLIVFLHGAGERGDDGLLATEVGIGRAIRRSADRFPCLVLMPQCPKDVWWDKAVGDIETSLAETRKDYPVDRDRIYLTGLSMGGYATWVFGAAKADFFAALMPICGGGNVEDAPKLARVPIWAFHGAKDDVVSPDKSREMVAAVKAARGTVHYTEYPDASHNSWDDAYGDAKAIKWLLKQSKAK